MAVRSHFCFVAGVCVIAAGLLMGGGAVAVADPGSGGSAAHGDNGTNDSGQPKKPKDDPGGTDTKGEKKDPSGTDTKDAKKDTEDEKKGTKDEKKDSFSVAAAPAAAPAPAAVAPAPVVAPAPAAVGPVSDVIASVQDLLTPVAGTVVPSLAAMAPLAPSGASAMGVQLFFRSGCGQVLLSGPLSGLAGLSGVGGLTVLNAAVVLPISLAALAALALPGAGGLTILTAAGVRVGYRQAKAGSAVRTAGIGCFARPGSVPLGVVRSGSLVVVRPRALRVARQGAVSAGCLLDEVA